MPILGNALDFSQYEAKQIRVHNLGAAPSSPVLGQLYYNTANNTLWWWDGTTWQSAKGGAPDASTSVKGLVQLAGDLAGTAASPQIAAGVIVDADVNSGAAIAESKLNLATDAAAAVGSRRTLGFTSVKAMPGNATLDQIAIPQGVVNMNNKQLTGLQDPPAAATDAATKNYVDQMTQGLDAHPSCRVATTANVTLIGGAPNTLDGVSLASYDRVLVKNQTTPAQNGIYAVTSLGTGANGNWTRVSDADQWIDLPSAYVWVEQGTVNADTGWVCTVDQGGTLETTAVTWVQFASAGTQVAGAGLTKTGNTLDVGAGAGITVAADTVAVANNGITNAMIADGAIALGTADVTGTLPIANGGTGAINVPNARVALGVPGVYRATGPPATGLTWTISSGTSGMTSTPLVQVMDAATSNVELPDIKSYANGDVVITWGAAVTLNTKTVILVG